LKSVHASHPPWKSNAIRSIQSTVCATLRSSQLPAELRLPPTMSFVSR